MTKHRDCGGELALRAPFGPGDPRAAYVCSLCGSIVAIVAAPKPPPPRRLLCAVCIQVNRTEPDQHIYEAMTIVHGAMVCHEHFDILIKERKFDWAVLSVREYLREERV